jgi:hypothetical protein
MDSNSTLVRIRKQFMETRTRLRERKSPYYGL